MARAVRAPTTRLTRTVAGLDPSAFAVVMATGIVSDAMHQRGADRLSAALLVVAGTAYVLLAVATTWRLVAFWPAARADGQDPARGFGYLTTVAASGVLASRLTIDHHLRLAEVLIGVAIVTWAVLGYLVPAAVALHRTGRPALGGASGSWFLWVVSAQSIAVSAADLAGLIPTRSGLILIALVAWSVGVVLYLLVASLVLVALLHRPLRVEHLSPTHWIFMGATAITVLAGARILAVTDVAPYERLAPVVAGMSFVLWAFGSWFIPLLVIGSVWRRNRREQRVRYETALWSIVFPLGMYSVATTSYADVTGLPYLHGIGTVAAWVALASWVAVAGGLVASVAQASGPGPGTRSA